MIVDNNYTNNNNNVFINNEDNTSIKNNNNYNNNIISQRSTNSGKMYSYLEDTTKKPIKESNAIRRSIGGGLNPVHKPPYTQDISHNNRKKYLDNLDDSSDESENKNPFGNQSSEVRIRQSENNGILNNPNFNKKNQFSHIPQLSPKPYYLVTYIIIGFFHAIMITLIGLFYEFKIYSDDNMNFNHIFLFFTDIHLFIFIGFGMLYSFLKNHQWSSTLLVLFLGTVSIEFSFIFYYIWANTFCDFGKGGWRKINIDFTILSRIEYNSASALIASGALLGKLSIIQYYVIVIFETFFSSLNYFLCYEKIKTLDNGGSLFIHTFGSFFGLAAAFVLFCKNRELSKINNNIHFKSDYYSNIFSAIGSVFLWLSFPSFNVATIQNADYINFNTQSGLGFITENLRYRGIINTYLSMAGSLFASFVYIPLLYKGKLKIENILNASYVGGIIIGGCCTICPSPWAAILIGFIGGGITSIFLSKIKKLLHNIKFEDSIGVFEIFGIPGFLGGFATCIFLGVFKISSAWNDDVFKIIFGNKKKDPEIQAVLQIAGIFITLGIAIFGGILTGFITSLLIYSENEEYFRDSDLIKAEDIILPEYENDAYPDNNLNSSPNEMIGERKEIYINNNNNSNIDNNIIS